MDIIARARRFVESLQELAGRREWDWRECPSCHSREVHKHGTYRRRPHTLQGRMERSIPRYRCTACGATYSQQPADLVVGSWYDRAVRRYAVDQWLHTGTSLRRVAEWVRSVIGRQERWQLWYPLSTPPAEQERCRLSHSTVHRWLDEAGERAERQTQGQYEGLRGSGLLGTDGLWARLRDGAVRVALMLRDSVTGLLYTPVVAVGEEAAEVWRELFAAAQLAGLALERLRAVTSDGAQGLLSYLRKELPGVYQQRCVWHTWRNLAGELGRQVAVVAKAQGQEAAEAVRRELVGMAHRVLDASSFERAEEALAALRQHVQGEGLWQVLNQRLDLLLAHLMPNHRGLGRVSPEWVWRDFRLRLSRGRNHGSEERLARAMLVWSIYRNFTPAQMRRERVRHYCHPGQSALQVAGAEVGGYCYLDALGV